METEKEFNQYVMDVGSFLDRFVPTDPSNNLVRDIKQTIDNEIKTNKIMKNNKISGAKYKLDPKIKISLIDKISSMLIFIMNESPTTAKEMTEVTGIPGCYLSVAKNKKYESLSSFMTAIIAASFNICVEGFDTGKTFEEFRADGVPILCKNKLARDSYFDLLIKYYDNNKPKPNTFNFASNLPEEKHFPPGAIKTKKAEPVRYDPSQRYFIDLLLKEKRKTIKTIEAIDKLLQCYEIREL